MSQNSWKPSSIVSIPFCHSHKPGALLAPSLAPPPALSLTPSLASLPVPLLASPTAPFPAPSMMPHALQMAPLGGACIFLIGHLQMLLVFSYLLCFCVLVLPLTVCFFQPVIIFFIFSYKISLSNFLFNCPIFI